MVFTIPVPPSQSTPARSQQEKKATIKENHVFGGERLSKMSRAETLWKMREQVMK
jgi:hypothetical protein